MLSRSLLRREKEGKGSKELTVIAVVVQGRRLAKVYVGRYSSIVRIHDVKKRFIKSVGMKIEKNKNGIPFFPFLKMQVKLSYERHSYFV